MAERNLRPTAIGRTLLPALVTAGALSLTAGSASAEYRVAAFADAPGYREIQQADYKGAAAVALMYESGADYAVHANRCVGLLKSNDLNAALTSCNRALRGVSANSWQPLLSRLDDVRSKRAVLYSNRGVVLAMQGRVTDARDDFERALALDEENANARSNLSVLNAREVSMR
jgi:Flp pilus assembly protein TadD